VKETRKTTRADFVNIKEDPRLPLLYFKRRVTEIEEVSGGALRVSIRNHVRTKL